MPRAGGCIEQGRLIGAVLKEVILENPETSNRDFNLIKAAFSQAGFSPKLVRKIGIGLTLPRPLHGFAVVSKHAGLFLSRSHLTKSAVQLRQAKRHWKW